MKASKYLGNFLRVDSLRGGPQGVTVRKVTEESVGLGEKARRKLVLHFVEIEQSLPLNVTNNRRMIKFFGDETDAWVGQKLTLEIGDVMGPSGLMDGIVVRDASPNA